MPWLSNVPSVHAARARWGLERAPLPLLLCALNIFARLIFIFGDDSGQRAGRGNEHDAGAALRLPIDLYYSSLIGVPCRARPTDLWDHPPLVPAPHPRTSIPRPFIRLARPRTRAPRPLAPHLRVPSRLLSLLPAARRFAPAWRGRAEQAVARPARGPLPRRRGHARARGDGPEEGCVGACDTLALAALT